MLYSGSTIEVIEQSIVCPAYFTSSGNYVSFTLLLNTVSYKEYIVTTSDMTVYLPGGGRLTWPRNFDTSYIKVVNTPPFGLRIELKFNTTQTPELATTALFSGNISVS